MESVSRIWLIALSLVLLAAGIHGAGAASEPLLFTVDGASCVDPIWHEAADVKAAERDADHQAADRCYPFQAQRQTQYQIVFDSAHCPSRFFGAKAAASYTCAELENH